MEAYLGRVRGLVIVLVYVFPVGGLILAHRLIDHGEPVEGPPSMRVGAVRRTGWSNASVPRATGTGCVLDRRSTRPLPLVHRLRQVVLRPRRAGRDPCGQAEADKPADL